MDANIVLTQFTSSATAVWAIQQLKNTRYFPWLHAEGQIVAKRLLSIASAIAIHTSISYVWNPGTQPGWHALVITIPPLSVIAVEMFHWLGQYVIQESFYQVVYNKPAAVVPVAVKP
jgi:hypothetical protein